MIGLDELVNQSRQICNCAEGEIDNIEREVCDLKHENESLFENFRQLENKYRDTMYLNEGAKDRIGGMHRMHVKARTFGRAARRLALTLADWTRPACTLVAL